MVKKIKQYKFLFEELVKRDFKKKYKGTVLGMVWSVLAPLMSLLIMKIVFTQFFGQNVPHYTIYLLCGNVIFNFFSEATSQGMTTLVDNGQIILKVNVPKYLFLMAKNVQALINFGLTLIVLFLFCAFDGITFTWKFVFLLYPIIMMVFFNTGLGLILSALHVFFRDMQYLWGIFTMLLTYASAIFYTIDGFSPTAQKLFYLNPVFLFIRYFRKIIIDGAIPSLAFHGAILAFTVAVVTIGGLIYKKYNTEFLYYI